MRKLITMILLMYSSLVAAQEQSFICQGEQIATIPYSAGNNGAAEIKPAEGSLNNQTWIFNEDGLALIGSTQLLLGISYCDFNDAGLPNCKALSNYFNIFNNNIFELNVTTGMGQGDDVLVTRTVVVGRCSRI